MGNARNLITVTFLIVFTFSYLLTLNWKILEIFFFVINLKLLNFQLSHTRELGLGEPLKFSTLL